MVQQNDEYNDSDQYSSAIAHYTLKTVSKVIKEWYIYTIKKKILIEIEKYIKNNNNNKILHHIIKQWFEISINQKLNKIKEKYIINKISKNILILYFKYWYYQHYLNNRNIFRIYNHIKQNHNIKFKNYIFYIWYKELLYHQKYLYFYKKRILNYYFNIWYNQYKQFNYIFIKFIHYKKKYIFLILYNYYIKKKQKKLLFINQQKYIQNKILYSYFNKWIILLKYSMNKRYKILQWQIKIQKYKIIQILYYWKSFIHKKKIYSHKYQILLIKYHYHIKYNIFHYWINLTYDHYKEKTFMIISGLNARKLLLYKTFYSFKNYLIYKQNNNKLKFKSNIIYIYYIIKIFFNHINYYIYYKNKLYYIQNKLNIIILNYYWYIWKKYIYNQNNINNKIIIIQSKYYKKLLFKYYKIWNFIWFKNITNKMIIKCINNKINYNLKKYIFLSIINIFKIKKSKLWIILSNFIYIRKLWSFQIIYKNMLYIKNKEINIINIYHKIIIYIFFKYWKQIIYQNKKIYLIQNLLIIKNIIYQFIQYNKYIYLINIIIYNYNKLLIHNIIKIWYIITKKKKNIKLIFNHINLNNIQYNIKLKIYFNKWYNKYNININIQNFIKYKYYKIIKYYYIIWFNNYQKIIYYNNKYIIIYNNNINNILKKYFIIWINNYKKRIINYNKMNKFINIYLYKLLKNIWNIIKYIYNDRINKKYIINKLFIIIKKYIYKKFWNNLNDIIYIEKSLEKVLYEYKLYINKKKIIIIYNNWKYIIKNIYEKKLKEIKLRNIYIYNLKKKYYNIWKLYFNYYILKYNIIENKIYNILKKNNIYIIINIIKKWYNYIKKKKIYIINKRILIKNRIKKYFYIIIELYNKYNIYKRNIFKYINNEFINNIIFNIQYNRVILKNDQMNITLNISIIIYNKYNIIKRYMNIWLNSLYNKIKKKYIIKKESEKLYILINYIKKRIIFNKLIDWNNWIIYNENLIKKRKELDLYNILIKELNILINNRNFTIEISRLFYNDYMKKKILEFIKNWRLISRYNIRCNNIFIIIKNRYNLNIISLIYYNWKNISNNYIKFYLLIKYIERPYKRYVIKELIYNNNYIKIIYKRKRYFLNNWYIYIIYKKDIINRYNNIINNNIIPRIIRLYFNRWRILYIKKIRIIELNKNINIIKPLRLIFNNWYNRYNKRKIKEKNIYIRRNIYYKRLILRLLKISYILIIKLKKDRIDLIKYIFNFCLILYRYKKKNRIILLNNIILNWRIYINKRINNRYNYELIIYNNNIRLKKKIYKNIILIYNKRIELKKKKDIIIIYIYNNNIRRYYNIWKNRIIINNRIKILIDYIINKNNRLILRIYYRIWLERFKKMILLRNNYNIFINKRRLRILYIYIIIWRNNWIPNRYLNISNIMIRILNKIILHNSFHKILRITFYGINLNRIDLLDDNNRMYVDDNNIHVYNGINNNMHVNNNMYVNNNNNNNLIIYSSYKLECNCTLKKLGIILKEYRFRWIIEECFKNILIIRRDIIIETLRILKKYKDIRIKYENGFNNLELCINKIILKRVWLIYNNNLDIINYIRKKLRIIINKNNKNIIRKYLINWINNYNNKIRYDRIIKLIRYKYEQTIIIKCFLIWSIKYNNNKKEYLLDIRINKIKIIYLFNFSIKKLNEYTLYNKWLLWCKKAYDTIEWVHNFRIKSYLFLYWKKYSIKQKRIKDNIILFYNKIILNIKRLKFDIWLNRIRIINNLIYISKEFYIDKILFKNYKLIFFNWKKISLYIRKRRQKLLKFLDIKKKSLLISCFKLWKFFIYYKKIRNERFNHIINIIKNNHNNLIIYRIFYSWKLKMIESLSLRNSIFLSLNNKIYKEDKNIIIKKDKYYNSINKEYDLIKYNNNLDESNLNNDSNYNINNNYNNIINDLFSSDNTSLNIINDDLNDNSNNNKDKINLIENQVNNNIQNLFSDGDLDIDELDSIERIKNSKKDNSNINNNILQPQINKDFIIHNVIDDLPNHYINNPYEPVSSLNRIKNDEMSNNSSFLISENDEKNSFIKNKYLYSDSDSNYSLSSLL